jgi:hypothetical protein
MGFTLYWTWYKNPDAEQFAQWSVDVKKLVENFALYPEITGGPLSLLSAEERNNYKELIVPEFTDSKVAFSATDNSGKLQQFFSVDLDNLNPTPNFIAATPELQKMLQDMTNWSYPIKPEISSDYWKTGISSFDVLLMAMLIRLAFYFPEFEITGGFKEDWKKGILLCEKIFGEANLPDTIPGIDDEDI